MANEYFSDADRRFMRLASELAFDNIDKGGGPFGAVIVRDGEIVSTGVNTVTLTNDPTAHAEVNAIRAACASEKTFSLKGCVVYSSCEPCPLLGRREPHILRQHAGGCRQNQFLRPVHLP